MEGERNRLIPEASLGAESNLPKDELFDFLYQRFFAAVVRYLEKRFPTPVAMELTQETFLKLFKSLDEFRHDCSIKSWIYRIADTTALNELRARSAQRRRGAEVPLDEPTNDRATLAEILPGEQNLQKRVEHREAIDCVERAMSELPQREREVALHYFVHELHYDEIAQVCGVSINTVKSQIHSARRKIRSRCAPHLLDEQDSDQSSESEKEAP